MMVFIWLKRVLVCSGTLTGGYCMSYYPKKAFINCKEKHDVQSSQEEDASLYIYLPKNGNDSNESNSTVWRKTKQSMYWKLLMLCRSKDHRVRQKAIESLSQLTLEKWQYIVVAQACDINTAVGLARSLNSNPHFFLPPPFKDLDKGNLQHEFYLMLSSLQFSNEDICIQNRVRQVVKSANSLHEYGVDLEVGNPLVLYHYQQKNKAIFLYNKLCLETVLACSVKSRLRILMMEKGILKLLLKVLQHHKSDTEMHSLIAQILANLAMEENFRNSIYMTGWIGILAGWKNSPYIAVSLPSAKALANLDNDEILKPIYEDGVYVLNPLCQLSKTDVSADVILIHGIRGATFWTWRQCDAEKVTPIVKNENSNNSTISRQYTMCWPKDWLAIDIPSLRIISLDYDTSITKWNSYCSQLQEKNSIKRRAKELTNKLLMANVGEKPIIWIAHSMGGLIVKEIMAEAFESDNEKIQSLLKKTAGMIFYSVPHRGSEVANKINKASVIFQPSSDIAELNKDSPNLLSLHEKFKNIISEFNIPILSFGETMKSHWGLNISVLVPPDSADPGFGEFYLLPADHLSTCKPRSTNSSEYVKPLNFLKDCLSKIRINEMHLLKKTDKIFEISKVMCLIP